MKYFQPIHKGSKVQEVFEKQPELQLDWKEAKNQEGQNHKAGKGKRRPKIKGWPKQKKAKMHLTSILHSFIWHFAFFPSREKTWAYLQEILPTITPYFWKTGSAMHIHQTSPHSTFLSSVQISEISEVMILFFF